MSYTPLPNPAEGIPFWGNLIDHIQSFLQSITGGGGGDFPDIDGGEADTVYGSVPSLDGGSA